MPQSNWESVVRLIAKLPTVVAAFHRLRHGDEAIAPRDDLDHAANFYWMLFEREPSPAVRKVLDACLILHAEHTMNASTFSGRVTGSTLANPVHGHQLGHRHADRPAARRRQRGSARHARRDRHAGQRPAVAGATRVANKKKIMGFGHRVYKVKDPRATVLAGVGRARLRRDQPAQEVRAGRRAGAGRRPASSGPRASIPTSISTPASSTRPWASRATCSRRSSPSPAWPAGWPTGWSSCKNNRIFRPEQIYVGKHDVPYVPLEKRP